MPTEHTAPLGPCRIDQRPPRRQRPGAVRSLWSFVTVPRYRGVNGGGVRSVPRLQPAPTEATTPPSAPLGNAPRLLDPRVDLTGTPRSGGAGEHGGRGPCLPPCIGTVLPDVHRDRASGRASTSRGGARQDAERLSGTPGWRGPLPRSTCPPPVDLPGTGGREPPGACRRGSVAAAEPTSGTTPTADVCDWHGDLGPRRCEPGVSRAWRRGGGGFGGRRGRAGPGSRAGAPSVACAPSGVRRLR